MGVVPRIAIDYGTADAEGRDARGMGGARAARRLLPHLRPPRLDRADLQSHHAARAGAGEAPADQPVRPALQRDHRLQPGQDRSRRQHPVGLALAHQSGGPRAARHRAPPHRQGALRDAHPHHRRAGGRLHQGRPVDDQLLFRAALRQGRLPRLRGHHRQPRGRPAHARGHGRQADPDPAQPRPAGLGRDAAAGLRAPVDHAARLRDPGGGQGPWTTS